MKNSAARVLLSFLFVSIAVASCMGQAPARPAPSDSCEQEATKAFNEARYPDVIAILSPVAADSLSGKGLFTLGSAYGAANDFEKSLRFLRKAVERDPERTAYRFLLGRTLATAGMVREAEVEYMSLLSRDSLFTPARFNLGMLAFDRREFPAAAHHFGGVISQQPRDYLALFYLGQCCSNQGLLDSARQYLAASLTLNPRYVSALNALASLYYRQGEYQPALRLYRTVLRDRPDQAEYWYGQGLCLDRLEDHQGARDSFREATRLDTANSLYFAHLGQAYFDMKKFDSSAAAYETAARLDEENPVLLLNLGLAYARMGSFDLAERTFKLAIAAHEPEQIARVYNQLGALLFLQRRYGPARKAYSSAILYDPANLEAHFYVAVTLDQVKQYPAAYDAYGKYLKLAGSDTSQQERIKAAELRRSQIGGKKGHATPNQNGKETKRQGSAGK